MNLSYGKFESRSKESSPIPKKDPTDIMGALKLAIIVGGIVLLFRPKERYIVLLSLTIQQHIDRI